MKTILLLTGCLTALRLIVTAQPSGQALAHANPPASITRNTVEETASVQATHDYAPSDNTPFFPGGQQALQAYFDNPALYPDLARTINADGTVKVLFRVMPNGQLTELRIVQSHEPLLDYSVLKAVAFMPRWFPAHRAGVAVSSLYILPVRFNLTSRAVSALEPGHGDSELYVKDTPKQP
ncbi:MAG: energy transducer TonB [Bacteroidetes bacterium]|nr:energy transducer TonB [Fibrella sp.]